MSHYSDPQHALLAKIANGLERIAVTLEANNNTERKNKALQETGDALVEHIVADLCHGKPAWWSETLVKKFNDAKNTP
jgi:hypothetical protein